MTAIVEYLLNFLFSTLPGKTCFAELLKAICGGQKERVQPPQYKIPTLKPPDGRYYLSWRKPLQISFKSLQRQLPTYCNVIHIRGCLKTQRNVNK